MSVLNETQKLKELVEQAHSIYLSRRENGLRGDFEKEVKPFVYKVDLQMNQFEEVVRPWLQQEKPLYLHPSQIDKVMENIELISVQAFFPESSWKRYHQYVQSTVYVLDCIIDAVNNVKKA
ncbi:DUF1798 family protein [Mangrovibacillus cuniculi]|uniref:DUF1798 family protein n=1 Tax=Mangrovibacillus cuniculi TaxID=2593652 RepID=A0A7S8CB00_9BACI|nr:DUF1798 family protein [Mangrovibacillus cuniculi]QPC46660.1 DUF1798 family protein [Mangrovibacillus cuniculi]